MTAITAILRGQNHVIMRVFLRVVPQIVQLRDSLLNLLVPEGLRPRGPVVLPCIALHELAPFPLRPPHKLEAKAITPIYLRRLQGKGRPRRHAYIHTRRGGTLA